MQLRIACPDLEQLLEGRGEGAGQAELPFQAGPQLQHLGRGVCPVQHRQGAARFATRLEQPGPLELAAAGLARVLCRALLVAQRAQQCLPIAAAPRGLGDARQHVGVVGPLDAQPLQPRQGGLGSEPVPRHLGGAGELLGPLFRRRILDGDRPRLQPILEAPFALEQGGELLTKRSGAERAGLVGQESAVEGDGLVRSSQGSAQQARALELGGPGVGGRRGGPAALLHDAELLLRCGAQRQSGLECIGVAGCQLQNAACVAQCGLGSLLPQHLHQLQADRDLAGPGQVSQLALEQRDQGQPLSQAAVDLAQRGFQGPVSRALGQRAAVGGCGLRQLLPLELDVSQAQQPVGARRAVVRGCRGALTQLHQIVRVAGAAVGRRQRLGHGRQCAFLVGGDLQCGDRPLQIVLVPLPHLRDLQPQRGALLAEVGSGVVVRFGHRQSGFEHGDDVVVASLLAVGLHQVGGGAAVTRVELEDPLVVGEYVAGSIQHVGVELGQARPDAELARGLRMAGELGLEGAGPVGAPAVDLVATRQSAPDVGALRPELGQGFQVGECRGLVTQVDADPLQAFEQLAALAHGRAFELVLQQLPQRRPATELLEQGRGVLGRLGCHGGILAPVEQLEEELHRLLGAAAPLLEEQRALQPEPVPLGVILGEGFLGGQELDQSLGVDLQAQGAFQARQGLLRLRCVLEDLPEQRGRLLRLSQLVEQDRGALQIQGHRLGTARIALRRALREALGQRVEAAAAPQQAVQVLGQGRGRLSLGQLLGLRALQHRKGRRRIPLGLQQAGDLDQALDLGGRRLPSCQGCERLDQLGLPLGQAAQRLHPARVREEVVRVQAQCARVVLLGLGEALQLRVDLGGCGGDWRAGPPGPGVGRGTRGSRAGRRGHRAAPAGGPGPGGPWAPPVRCAPSVGSTGSRAPACPAARTGARSLGPGWPAARGRGSPGPRARRRPGPGRPGRRSGSARARPPPVGPAGAAGLQPCRHPPARLARRRRGRPPDRTGALPAVRPARRAIPPGAANRRRALPAVSSAAASSG